MCKSVPQMPAAATSIKTSSGPGFGSGASITLAWPGVLICAANIAYLAFVSFLVLISILCFRHGSLLHYLIAPAVRPRTRYRCATQPAIITGATANVAAADILAQYRPSDVLNPTM